MPRLLAAAQPTLAEEQDAAWAALQVVTALLHLGQKHQRSFACLSPLHARSMNQDNECPLFSVYCPQAVFLNPTDALHGDIGIVGRHDLVVIVSKSGATEELLRLVPYAKVQTLATTSAMLLPILARLSH
jgi:hypothetical protein